MVRTKQSAIAAKAQALAAAEAVAQAPNPERIKQLQEDAAHATRMARERAMSPPVLPSHDRLTRATAVIQTWRLIYQQVTHTGSRGLERTRWKAQIERWLTRALWHTPLCVLAAQARLLLAAAFPRLPLSARASAVEDVSRLRSNVTGSARPLEEMWKAWPYCPPPEAEAFCEAVWPLTLGLLASSVEGARELSTNALLEPKDRQDAVDDMQQAIALTNALINITCAEGGALTLIPRPLERGAEAAVTSASAVAVNSDVVMGESANEWERAWEARAASESSARAAAANRALRSHLPELLAVLVAPQVAFLNSKCNDTHFVGGRVEKYIRPLLLRVVRSPAMTEWLRSSDPSLPLASLRPLLHFAFICMSDVPVPDPSALTAFQEQQEQLARGEPLQPEYKGGPIVRKEDPRIEREGQYERFEPRHLFLKGEIVGAVLQAERDSENGAKYAATGAAAAAGGGGSAVATLVAQHIDRVLLHRLTSSDLAADAEEAARDIARREDDYMLRSAVYCIELLTKHNPAFLTPARVQQWIGRAVSLLTTKSAPFFQLTARFLRRLVQVMQQRLPVSLLEPSIPQLTDMLTQLINDADTNPQMLLELLPMVPALCSLAPLHTLTATPASGSGRPLLLPSLLSLAHRYALDLPPPSLPGLLGDFVQETRYKLVVEMFAQLAAVVNSAEADVISTLIQPQVGVTAAQLMLRIQKHSVKPATWGMRGGVLRHLTPVLHKLLSNDELLHLAPLLHAQLLAGLKLEARNDEGEFLPSVTDLRMDCLGAWVALVPQLRDDFLPALRDCLGVIEEHLSPTYWKPADVKPAEAPVSKRSKRGAAAAAAAAATTDADEDGDEEMKDADEGDGDEGGDDEGEAEGEEGEEKNEEDEEGEGAEDQSGANADDNNSDDDASVDSVEEDWPASSDDEALTKDDESVDAKGQFYTTSALATDTFQYIHLYTALLRHFPARMAKEGYEARVAPLMLRWLRCSRYDFEARPSLIELARVQGDIHQRDLSRLHPAALRIIMSIRDALTTTLTCAYSFTERRTYADALAHMRTLLECWGWPLLRASSKEAAAAVLAQRLEERAAANQSKGKGKGKAVTGKRKGVPAGSTTGRRGEKARASAKGVRHVDDEEEDEDEDEAADASSDPRAARARHLSILLLRNCVSCLEQCDGFRGHHSEVAATALTFEDECATGATVTEQEALKLEWRTRRQKEKEKQEAARSAKAASKAGSKKGRGKAAAAASSAKGNDDESEAGVRSKPSVSFVRLPLVRARLQQWRAYTHEGHTCDAGCKDNCNTQDAIAELREVLRFIGCLSRCGPEGAAMVRSALLDRAESAGIMGSEGTLWHLLQLYSQLPLFRNALLLACGDLIVGVPTPPASAAASAAAAADSSSSNDVLARAHTIVVQMSLLIASQLRSPLTPQLVSQLERKGEVGAIGPDYSVGVDLTVSTAALAALTNVVSSAAGTAVWTVVASELGIPPSPDLLDSLARRQCDAFRVARHLALAPLAWTPEGEGGRVPARPLLSAPLPSAYSAALAYCEESAHFMCVLSDPLVAEMKPHSSSRSLAKSLAAIEQVAEGWHARPQADDQPAGPRIDAIYATIARLVGEATPRGKKGTKAAAASSSSRHFTDAQLVTARSLLDTAHRLHARDGLIERTLELDSKAE